MKSTLNWDDVRYFITLYRSGSLAAAARELNVEHATVSRRISRLEAALKIKLFDRLSKGWTLTAEGKSLYSHAQNIENDSLALERAASSVSSLVYSVSVSAPPAILSHLVAPKLETFYQSQNELVLELVGETRKSNLIRAESDIALRLGVVPEHQDLIIRRIAFVEYGLFACPAIVAQPEVDWQFIGFDDKISNMEQKLWIESEAGKRPLVLYTNNLEVMLRAVQSGVGVALLPKFYVEPKHELQMLTTRNPEPQIPLYLILHPDLRKSPRVRLVADFLVDNIQSRLTSA